MWWSAALEAVAKPVHRLALGQPEKPLRALQRLNIGLFAHRKHQPVLRRIQIQSHQVRRLRSKLRVSADALTASSLQLDLMLAQDALDVIGTDIAQRFRQ